MSGRGEERSADQIRGWLRGVLVVVVIGVLLGVFGAAGGPLRPSVNALQLAGIAVMIAGAALAALARRLTARVADERREPAVLALKLGGVAVCAAGAMLVFAA